MRQRTDSIGQALARACVFSMSTLLLGFSLTYRRISDANLLMELKIFRILL
jgi:hypothetical protein